MKKISLLIFMVLVTTVVAMAVTPPYGADVLGAHNGYGRGCVMCHAPHSGVLGNGAATSSDTQNGMIALWGENVVPLEGATANFGGGSYPVTFPGNGSLSGSDPNTTSILFCLSCHDGNVAKGGMMVGTTVETLPIVGGNAPTLLNGPGVGPGGTGNGYQNDHPVGILAVVGCGTAAHGWDCTAGTATTPILMNGPASTAFLTNNPSSFWNSAPNHSGVINPLATYTGTTMSAVVCTTCHNQHSMTSYSNTSTTTVGGKTSTTVFATMFFIKGQYTPGTGGNSVAQFCRNCHGGESNEMNGVMSVPTI